MKKSLIVATILVFLAILWQWYMIYYNGKQFKSMAPLPNLITGSFPIWGAILAFLLSRFIHRFKSSTMLPICLFLLGSATFSMYSCAERAQANQQTLLTTDCGVTWNLIKTGEAIPKCYSMCQCHYSVKVPDYPMQGESRFKIMFKGKVLANIDVSYDYAITNAIAFISEAKYLGKMNASADDASNASSAYEMAENAVIDKRIKEVARDFIAKEDVVDFSPSDLEDSMLLEVNLRLKDRGVVLNFLNFVPQFDEQTRLAIDVATAEKIYESKGLTELGRAILIARSGATKIVIEERQQDGKTTQDE